MHNSNVILVELDESVHFYPDAQNVDAQVMNEAPDQLVAVHRTGQQTI